MSADDPKSSADTTPTDTPTALPTAAPVTGAGSAELVTESNDPAELRALLQRARERLSFYESFDRMIGEQMRRTGEMMAETVSLREQAAQAIRDREAIDQAVREERERHRAVLEGALAEVRNARPVIDAMVARLQSAIETISDAEPLPERSLDQRPASPSGPPEDRGERDTDDAGAAADAAPAETESQVPTPAPEEDLLEPEDDTDETSPSSIEVLAHGVPSATTAIALQSMLRGLDTVTNVDAREFADGELRLHVECTGPIADDALTGWLGKHSGRLVSRNDNAIELGFTGNL